MGGGSALGRERNKNKSREGDDSGTGERQQNQARRRPAAWETACGSRNAQNKSPGRQWHILNGRGRARRKKRRSTKRTSNPPTLLRPQGDKEPGYRATGPCPAANAKATKRQRFAAVRDVWRPRDDPRVHSRSGNVVHLVVDDKVVLVEVLGLQDVLSADRHTQLR